jgi:hypothetical protein
MTELSTCCDVSSSSSSRRSSSSSSSSSRRGSGWHRAWVGGPRALPEPACCCYGLAVRRAAGLTAWTGCSRQARSSRRLLPRGTATDSSLRPTTGGSEAELGRLKDSKRSRSGARGPTHA